MLEDVINGVRLFLEASGLLAVVHGFLYLLDRDRFFIWIAKLARLIGLFYRRANRFYIAKDIEGRIGQAAKAFHADIGVLPHTLTLEWVETGNIESFVRDGGVIVRMGVRRHKEHNLAIAASAYISGGLLPGSHAYVATKVIRASELYLTYQLLTRLSRESLHYFLREIYTPEIDADQGLDQLIQQIRAVDDRGLFIPIFLSEMADLGQRLFGTPPSNKVRNETRRFLEFLHEIALDFRVPQSKPPEERVALDFPGDFLRVHIVIFARHTTVATYGLAPYVERCRRLTAARRPCSIYVCALDRRTGQLNDLVQAICALEGIAVVGSIHAGSSGKPFTVARLRYEPA